MCEMLQLHRVVLLIVLSLTTVIRAEAATAPATRAAEGSSRPASTRLDYPTYGISLVVPAGFDRAPQMKRAEAIFLAFQRGKLEARGYPVTASIVVSMKIAGNVSVGALAEGMVQHGVGQITGEIMLDGHRAIRLQAPQAGKFAAFENVIVVKNDLAYYISLWLEPGEAVPASWPQFLADLRWRPIEPPAHSLDDKIRLTPIFRIVRADVPASVRRMPDPEKGVEEYLVHNFVTGRSEFAMQYRLFRMTLPVIGERQKLARYIRKQIDLPDDVALWLERVDWPGAPENSFWTPFLSGGRSRGGLEMWGMVAVSEEHAVAISLHILGNTAPEDIDAYRACAHEIARSIRVDPEAVKRATSRPTSGPSTFEE